MEATELDPSAEVMMALPNSSSEIFDESDDSNSTNQTQQLIFYPTPSLLCGLVMIMIATIGILGNVITALVFSYTKRSCPMASSSASIAPGGGGANGGSYMSAASSSSSPQTIAAAVAIASPSNGCGGGSRTGSSRLSSIAILVTGLACVDAILLSVSCPLFASSAFYAYDPTLPLLNAVSYMTVYIYPIASTFQTISVWILAVITIERYIAVVHPFVARRVCTPSRAVWALFLIVAVSFAYNATRFFEYMVYRIVAEDDPNIVLIIAMPKLRANPNYMRIYGHWLYFVFIFALPFAILVLLNGSVVRAVRSARCERRSLSRQQTKEQSTAMMMVVVCLVFLSCNLLAFVLNALEVFGGSGAKWVPLPGESSESSVRHSSYFYLLVDFNNTLVMLHCSANFFVYYNFSERFKLGFHRLLRRWSKLWFCFCGADLFDDDETNGMAMHGGRSSRTKRVGRSRMSSCSMGGGDSISYVDPQHQSAAAQHHDRLKVNSSLTLLTRLASTNYQRSRRLSSGAGGLNGGKKNSCSSSTNGTTVAYQGGEWTIGDAPIRQGSGKNNNNSSIRRFDRTNTTMSASGGDSQSLLGQKTLL